MEPQKLGGNRKIRNFTIYLEQNITWSFSLFPRTPLREPGEEWDSQKTNGPVKVTCLCGNVEGADLEQNNQSKTHIDT